MTGLADFDVLSFDCYGTLIDWEAGIAAVLRPWASAAGLSSDDDALLAAYGRHEAETERTEPTALYPQVLARSFRALGEELGRPVTDADAERLGRSVPDWPAFPDSHDALVSLQESYQLVILSNVDRESFRGSEARLGVRFDHVITAQDVGAYKPSDRGFEVLRADLAARGIAPGRHLHVAQSLFHDHVPARRAGLPTVWINRRGDRPGWGATPDPGGAVAPDWEFGSMKDFAAACRSAQL